MCWNSPAGGVERHVGDTHTKISGYCAGRRNGLQEASSQGPALELTALTLPGQGPFCNFCGLDYGQNEQVTGVTTDRPEFGKGDPEDTRDPHPLHYYGCAILNQPKKKKKWR